MVITLGQQYNVGEKPTVILYTHINRHAETPTKRKTKQYIIKHKDKYNTTIETRTAEDHDDENLHNPETVQDAVIHLEVDELLFLFSSQRNWESCNRTRKSRVLRSDTYWPS